MLILLTIATLLHVVIHWLQPALVPICLVSAWALVLFTSWNLWSVGRASLASAQRMHQIPCTECRFYTGDYRLKCPVNPTIAMSEAAIQCPDYEAKYPKIEYN